MKYDFDTEISRQGTNSVKWEFVQEGETAIPWDQTDPALGDRCILPMWIADMDFPCPQPVVDALVARAGHPIYGYTEKTAAYDAAEVNWMRRRQGWQVAPPRPAR